MNKDLRQALVRAKQIADDKEYQRARMAHSNGQRDLDWLDFFIEALDNMEIALVKFPRDKYLTQYERVEE